MDVVIPELSLAKRLQDVTQIEELLKSKAHCASSFALSRKFVKDRGYLSA